MNYNTLSGSAKLYKKVGLLGTGQMVASGEMPNIAIITTLNAFEHKRLIESVGFGVRSCGGAVNVFYTPFFGFSNKTNPMTAKYTDSFRRVAASNAEAIIKTNLIDGVIVVTDCDITAAGIIEGAARANCPVLVISTGTFDFSADMSKGFNAFQIPGAVTGGKLNLKDSEDMLKDVFFPHGIRGDFNSTSSFFIVAEAMGLSVPGASLCKVDSGNHFRAAVATGEQMCKSAKDLISPRKFLTRENLGNAIALCLSIGADIGALSHFTNLVKIYDPKIPHELISEYTTKTPLLVAPDNQTCNYLNKIGINSIYKKLASTPKLIDETVIAYNGEKLRSILTETQPAELEPISKAARAVLCKGSAVGLGGYAQPTSQTPVSISGKAWVYDNLEAADKALLSGSISNGVIVVHNCVDTYVTCLAYAIEGMQKQNDIAIITDGLCEKTSCLVVTRCTPDSFANQEFANIQNGDVLEIDLAKGRLNSNVLAKEQKHREKRNSVIKPAIYFS